MVGSRQVLSNYRLQLGVVNQECARVYFAFTPLIG
jgi:hypothetical protein